MNWVTYTVTSVTLLVVFLLTGAPVTPHWTSASINHFKQKDTYYYVFLAFHYWLGAMTIGFLIVGGFRNMFWNKDGKQGGMVWCYAFLLAGIFCAIGSHTLMPPPIPATDAGFRNLEMPSGTGQH